MAPTTTSHSIEGMTGSLTDIILARLGVSSWTREEEELAERGGGCPGALWQQGRLRCAQCALLAALSLVSQLRSEALFQWRAGPGR